MRPLRKLKFWTISVLTLFGAIRIPERIWSLMIEPITVQREVFGRIVAYPWQASRIDIRFNRDIGLYKIWSFKLPSMPPTLSRCVPDLAPPRTPTPDFKECWVDEGGEGAIQVTYMYGAVHLARWPYYDQAVQ